MNAAAGRARERERERPTDLFEARLELLAHVRTGDGAPGSEAWTMALRPWNQVKAPPTDLTPHSKTQFPPSQDPILGAPAKAKDAQLEIRNSTSHIYPYLAECVCEDLKLSLCNYLLERVE